MFNPAMFGLTAQQMEAGKEAGHYLRLWQRPGLGTSP